MKAPPRRTGPIGFRETFGRLGNHWQPKIIAQMNELP
jgi:hypothetical protein